MADYPHYCQNDLRVRERQPDWFIHMVRLTNGMVELVVSKGSTDTVTIQLSSQEVDDVVEMLSGQYVMAQMSSFTDYRLHQASCCVPIKTETVPEEELLNHEP